MKIALTFTLTAATILFSACSGSSDGKQVVLTADKFEEKIRESEDEIILDVRTPEEFAEGHIPGAVLMNINDPGFEQRINDLPKSRAVLVYCAAGVRSAKAAAILQRSGFEEVYHLGNGLQEWSKAQKEIVK